MGYYTEFTLSASGDDSQKAIDALKERSCYSWDGDTIYDAKWYDWADDLAFVSKVFPGVLLIVDGYGEESPDIWRAFALNGNVEKVVASISALAPEWAGDGASLNRLADRT